MTALLCPAKRMVHNHSSVRNTPRPSTTKRQGIKALTLVKRSIGFEAMVFWTQLKHVPLCAEMRDLSELTGLMPFLQTI